ncbi:MAG: phosphate signaling complex protein PhoU [Planctomycetes bacterium]|nr:phosphate signaling complex protein PhoU [Planctomycetota bacterium]
MKKHLQHDLDDLKKDILTMGSLVEESIDKAIAALVHRRPEIAVEVSSGDALIDQKELAIEDKCLKMLALHQPVAGDLRFIIGCIKVNNDLERMGDHAQAIAERAAFLSTHPPIEAQIDFQRMVLKVQGMVKRGLDALVNLDAELARAVAREDDQVDAYHKQMFGELQDLMQREPATIERAVHTLSVVRHLERIGDLATNIAEDIVFMVDGEVIRHHGGDAARAARLPNHRAR